MIAVLILTVAVACTPARDAVQASLSQTALGGLAPASLGYDVAVSQVVRGELLGQGRSLRFELEVTGNDLVLVGLTHAGIPLFTLTQGREGTSFDRQFPGEGALDPAYLLADIKFAYWPLEALNLVLGVHRMRVYERFEHGLRHRLLKDRDGRAIVEASYPREGEVWGDLVLRRHDIPYRLRIKTLRVSKEERR